MNFVKHQATTSKSNYTDADFEEIKKSYLDEVVTMVIMQDIQPKSVLNWNLAGIM